MAVTLDDVADWASGGTPSRTRSEHFGGSVPWFKTGELGPRLLVRSEEQLTGLGLSASSAKLFPKGAVALAMYGATIGKTSILGVQSATNQACAVGIPTLVSSEFLYYFLLSQADAFAKAGKGGAQPNISQGIVRSWPIAVPPVAEQRRVVEALDEVLSEMDQGVSELLAAWRKLALYRQSLLKSAVEGTLTAEWRRDNPAQETGHELLARLLVQRHALWSATRRGRGTANQYVGAVQPQVDGLPVVPDGWAWASLDMLGDIASGIAKGSKTKPDEPLREVPYLRVANVQRGRLDLGEVKHIPATARDIAELALHPGDVLFNEGGDRDKLGRGWVWNGELPLCIHQNHVFRMRPFLAEVEPEFVSHYGNSFGQHWFEAAGKQTTNLASINLRILRAFPVPVPPAAEQRQIIRMLRDQLDAIGKQEEAINRALAMATAQRQNILRAAFSGQLVPQDPNDEPAGVLLERIRATREITDAKAPARRGRKEKIAA